MKSIISWAIRNSPAMNTLLIGSMLVGAISFVVMRREVFPNFALEILLVSVPFPGATPEEVEEGICQKIESVVSGVEGVNKMTAVARESYGYIILELGSDVTDVQKVLNDVRSQVDQIASFPPRAEDPEIKQIVFRAPAITLGILGPPPNEDVDPLVAEKQLRDLAEEVRAEVLELRAVPPKGWARWSLRSLFQPKGTAVSGADIVAERPYEIAVEVPEDRLRQYGISIDGLAQLLRMQNVDMPGGKMETASQEVLLRGDNKQEIGAEIAKIPILTQSNGDIVRLAPGKPGKIAEIEAGRLVLDGDIIAAADGQAVTMRRRIAHEGVVVVVLARGTQPVIEAIGLPLDEDMPEFIAETQGDILKAIGKLKGHHANDPAAVYEAARLAARRAARRWSGKNPQVRVIMPGLGVAEDG